MTTTGFTFDAATHKYALEGRGLPGVTTIVRVLDKPALLQWAADEALDAISKVKEPTPQDWEAARFAWRTKRDKAGEKGTATHDIVEAYVREWIAEWSGNVFGEWVEQTDIDPRVMPFVQWAADNAITFLDCEVVQYSEEHWFAGRFDLLYEDKGGVWLGDIKTSKGVYPDYFAQLGGYDIMCTERGVHVDHRAVLHLGKELTVHPSFDQQRDRDFFLACLKIYNTLKTF